MMLLKINYVIDQLELIDKQMIVNAESEAVKPNIFLQYQFF